ncbi:deaminase [Arthrobacter sp. UYEF20]|uniref:nucleoside deaminase n=1 Tax=Arthrobacter sp. UYEF20 TaxID=1756363 RepID=UPI003391DE72
MNRTHAELLGLMEEAVEFGVRHVEAGGLPFVGVLVGPDGYVSAPGVNLAHETGDPSAHAEIVAMRAAMRGQGLSDLQGTWLLATGEPCGLCYRFAIDHRVGRIYVAVDSDIVAEQGFDYRGGYAAYGIDRTQLADMMHRLPVEHGLDPFQRFMHLRQGGVNAPLTPATPTKGNKS